MKDSRDFTQILLQIEKLDDGAYARLLPLVYEELHSIARRCMARERGDHTLQATALVHEAYFRMIDHTRVEWQNRAHFLAVASTAMRRILMNHAKAKGAAKRGGDAGRVDLDEALSIHEESAIDLERLDVALVKLAEIDPRQAKIVEMRFFGGATEDETAQALEISVRTVRREWAMAKAWLRQRVSDD